MENFQYIRSVLFDISAKIMLVYIILYQNYVLVICHKIIGHIFPNFQSPRQIGTRIDDDTKQVTELDVSLEILGISIQQVIFVCPEIMSYLAKKKSLFHSNLMHKRYIIKLQRI